MIVIAAVLGILILMLQKIVLKGDQKPRIKRNLNVLEDALRLTVYVLLIILTTPFIMANSSEFTLYVAYWLFVIGVFLYLIRTLIKWISHCRSKIPDLKPWSKKMEI